MKRLIASPRPSSPRLTPQTVHALRFPPQTPPPSRTYASGGTFDKNFDSRKAAVTDRHRLDSQSIDYTGSGTDAAVAERSDVSFDPSKSSVDPEQARKLAGQGGDHKVNPLEVSPANRAVSETSREAEGGRNTVSVKGETMSYFSKTTVKKGDRKMGMGGEKKVFKGFDRRQERQTPTVVKPGSR